MALIWCLIFIVKLSLILGQEQEPVVTIPDGKLRGSVNQTIGENVTFYAFRGIPFAKKPVGDLRFASPVKNDPWTGILDATQDKDSCIQPTTNVVAGGTGTAIIGSEDCLYINVYTTDISGSLPVMVWIYGGGFNTGSSSYEIYAPDYLLEKGVVYVSFNYRLGVFGFLSTEDLEAPGNWGLKDQVLALKWVKKNIRYFGGDPEKVTIFGESAGSASVSYLVQSDLTEDLYRGAIMQSGTTLCLWSLTLNARRKAFTVGAKLGIFTFSSETLIDELRKKDATELKLADVNVTLKSFLTDSVLAGLPFGVVNEPSHAEAVFSGKSHKLLKEGQFQKVSLIIGHNSNEGGGLQDYVNALRPVLFQYELDVTRLAPYDLTQNYLKRLPAGFDIRTHYFGPGPIASQNAAIAKFATVDQFNRPVRETVNVMSAYTNVYFYVFSYRGLLGNPNATYEGVSHAEDLNYLFVRRGRNSSAQDELTRDKLVTLWTNFAITGNPTPPVENTVLEDDTWIANTPQDNTSITIKYFDIGKTLTMKNNPDQLDWEFYQNIYGRYGDPPFTTY